MPSRALLRMSHPNPRRIPGRNLGSFSAMLAVSKDVAASREDEGEVGFCLWPLVGVHTITQTDQECRIEPATHEVLGSPELAYCKTHAHKAAREFGLKVVKKKAQRSRT